MDKQEQRKGEESPHLGCVSKLVKYLLPLKLTFHKVKLEVLALLDDKDEACDHERDKDNKPHKQ